MKPRAAVAAVDYCSSGFSRAQAAAGLRVLIFSPRRPAVLLTLLTGLLLSLSSLITPAPSRAASSKQESAIELKQTHYFLGDHIVTAANDAVRIQNIGRLKYVVIAKAPDWRVNIYRSDDKTYFSESLREFAETGLVSDFLVGRRDRAQEANQFLKSPMTFLGKAIIRMTGGRRSYKYLPLPHGMAKEVELVIYSTYKLTSWYNLPLEETGRTRGTDFLLGEPKTHVQTYLSTSAIRDVKISPEIFDLPPNYKRARSLREVVAGSDTRAESVDAQELFETGREHKKRSQTNKQVPD